MPCTEGPALPIAVSQLAVTLGVSPAHRSVISSGCCAGLLLDGRDRIGAALPIPSRGGEPLTIDGNLARIATSRQARATLSAPLPPWTGAVYQDPALPGYPDNAF